MLKQYLCPKKRKINKKKEIHLEHLKALLITYFKNRANQAFFINSKIQGNNEEE